MVDYELFESILEKFKDGFIEDGDYIDVKTMDLFIKHGLTNIKMFFKTYAIPSYYYVDVRCGCCGKIQKQMLSKSKVVAYINDVRQKRNTIRCNECYLEEERKRLEKRDKDCIAWAKTKEQNTEEYIKRYLDSNHSWKDGVSTYEKRSDLQQCFVDWQKISDYICAMDYHDFLQTPYWKAVAESVKKYHGFRCQLCNGTEGLSVHHKSYDIHGDELHNMKDLVCLCRDCHEKFHEVGVYADL